jgi:hypothetical protein
LVVGPTDDENPSTFMSLQAKDISYGNKKRNTLEQILNICDVAHSVINTIDCLVELEQRPYVIDLLNMAATDPTQIDVIIGEFAGIYMKELQIIRSNVEQMIMPRGRSFLAREYTKDYRKSYASLTESNAKANALKCIDGMLLGIQDFLRRN